jgi:murein DD-endopeptidase MepM/ murein hydrolase activator NlpD
MLDSFREQTWNFVSATFPERQIYIRADGRVQFFTFGPLMQAILAGISLIFLGWVAFTSVNVIFKDRIIATKERRYQQMQASYEARIADQQLNLDELNSAMITTADRFRAQADALEAKQRTLTALVTHKQQLRATLGLDPARARPAVQTTVVGSAPAPALPTATPDTGTAAVGTAPVATPTAAPAATPASTGSGDLPMLQAPVPAAPRTARPQRSTFLKGAVQKLADLFGPERAPKPTRAVEHPALTQIAQLEGQLTRLKGAQYVLLAQAQQDVSEEIAHFQNAIRVAGLDPNGLVARVSARGGVGGPLIPIPPEALTGVNDAAFDNHVTAVLSGLEDLRTVVTAMRVIPMSPPVRGGSFDQTSGYGARLDPFTRHFAFHAGLDWSGPWGAPIQSTAPGTVVFAGWRGGYGQTVEVDHGYGFKTRYGHMSSIAVRVGQRVVKGSQVGRLGSSGRSTGPHIHYEVWFDNTVRDPGRFLRAGRYVLER